jgi:hypothetical protein
MLTFKKTFAKKVSLFAILPFGEGPKRMNVLFDSHLETANIDNVESKFALMSLLIYS